MAPHFLRDSGCVHHAIPRLRRPRGQHGHLCSARLQWCLPGRVGQIDQLAARQPSQALFDSRGHPSLSKKVTRKRPRRRWRIARFLPAARLRRHALRGFRRAPMLLQTLIVVAMALILWLAVNWVYQVVRKPSELFFPVSGTLNKTPTETWRQYSRSEEHTSELQSPDHLVCRLLLEK